MIAICDDAAVCGYIELLICIGIGTSESDVDEEITKGPVTVNPINRSLQNTR